MAMSGYKVELSSGKVVLLRKMKIADQLTASEAAGLKFTTSNGQLMATAQEMLKQLLFKINDKELSASEKEDLDALFEMEEYSQLMDVVIKTSGMGEKKTSAKMEIVNIGKP